MEKNKSHGDLGTFHCVGDEEIQESEEYDVRFAEWWNQLANNNNVETVI